MGLSLAFHQATRSEKLVNIFHAAGHTVGIDKLRRIDSPISYAILRRYEQNGYIYIPTGISPYTPGHIIISSFHNFNVLEETIDGKNTFHATQCVLWQRGPPSQPKQMTVKRGRNRIPDQKLLETFHIIDIAPVYTGARSNLTITSNVRVEPEIWDMGNGCQSISNLSNARMYNQDEQKVPSRAAFNAACGVSEATVTVVGMLPIIQAHADENNTVMTILNKFQEMMNHLGKKHVVIVRDQPLYGRTKNYNGQILMNMIML